MGSSAGWFAGPDSHPRLAELPGGLVAASNCAGYRALVLAAVQQPQ
jgi:hypothetical protein